MGTAIHASIEEALAVADPTGKKYVVESESILRRYEGTR